MRKRTECYHVRPTSALGHPISGCICAVSHIRASYPDVSASDAMLSYDDVPAKWAWRIVVGGPKQAVAYITPGWWYEKQMTRDEGRDREG